MKWKLATGIASQLYLIFFIWLSIRNIHRHINDEATVNISLLSIIFFTALCSASLTVSIGNYMRARKLQPWTQKAPYDPKKERNTQLLILAIALVGGAAAMLFIK